MSPMTGSRGTGLTLSTSVLLIVNELSHERTLKDLTRHRRVSVGPNWEFLISDRLSQLTMTVRVIEDRPQIEVFSSLACFLKISSVLREDIMARYGEP